MAISRPVIHLMTLIYLYHCMTIKLKCLLKFNFQKSLFKFNFQKTIAKIFYSCLQSRANLMSFYGKPLILMNLSFIKKDCM